MTLEEIAPLIIAKASAELEESGITKPNALLKEQTFLDQHWKDPVLVLDGKPSLVLESREGDPAVFLLLQPMHIEAEKSEAKGRTKMWPLSEATQQQTVDEHAQLISGSLHIHCRIALPNVPTQLKDVRIVLHIMAAPAQLKPETDMGTALPIPGVRDIVQKVFESKLKDAESDNKQHKQIEITAVTKKIKSLPEALQQAKVKDVKIITKKSPDGIVASAELAGDLSLLDA